MQCGEELTINDESYDNAGGAGASHLEVCVIVKTVSPVSPVFTDDEFQEDEYDQSNVFIHFTESWLQEDTEELLPGKLGPKADGSLKKSSSLDKIEVEETHTQKMKKGAYKKIINVFKRKSKKANDLSK